jgi:hypothetical protein
LPVPDPYRGPAGWPRGPARRCSPAPAPNPGRSCVLLPEEPAFQVDQTRGLAQRRTSAPVGHRVCGCITTWTSRGSIGGFPNATQSTSRISRPMPHASTLILHAKRIAAACLSPLRRVASSTRPCIRVSRNPMPGSITSSSSPILPPNTGSGDSCPPPTTGRNVRCGGNGQSGCWQTTHDS